MTMNCCNTADEQCSEIKLAFKDRLAEIELAFKDKFGYHPPEHDFDLYIFSYGWFSGMRSLLAELADELTTSILYSDIDEICCENISDKVNIDLADEGDLEVSTKIQIAAFIYDLLTQKQRYYENASCKF